MNKYNNVFFAPIILTFIIYFAGPDLLSIILNGMPLEEGSNYYAGNGWAYLGRDLDFYLEGISLFAIDSIWRLMPLKVVLPQVQPLLFIGVIQIFCYLLLTKYFYANHRILTHATQTIAYSKGKSLQISFTFILGLGLTLFTLESFYYFFYQKDLIFEQFVSIDIDVQKLNLHPLYQIAFILVGCLGAAIFEETLFRRILFPMLRMKMPFGLSAILNILLFVCMHLIFAGTLEFDWMVILQTSICGLIGCIIFEYSKSIIGCILFHFTGNLFIFLIPILYPLDQFQ